MTSGQPHALHGTEVRPRRSLLGAFDPLLPQRTGQRLNIAIVIAILMSLTYAIQMLIDMAKPPPPSSPVWFIRLVPIPFPVTWYVTEVTMFLGWGIAVAAGLVGLVMARAGSADGKQIRVVQIVVVAVLLLPYVIFPVTIIFENFGHLLLCVLTTAFGLWLLQRMQRFHKFPVQLLLTGFAWGALIAAGFAICMDGWFAHYGANFFLDLSDFNGTLERLVTSMAFNTGVFGELGKIAGITLLFVFFRRHFDGMVSGIVIGAAVGLGVNFTESLQYMNASGGISLLNAGGVASRYWFHQILGLMASQVAFGAIAGAGFGVARQLRDTRQRWIAVVCGCLTATAAHFYTDVILAHFVFQKMLWSRESPWFETLVAEPLLIAITSGPFVVLYLILLGCGHRSQAHGLSTQVSAEASSGLGAITVEEKSVILSSAARFFLRINALRNIGLSAYRVVRSIQAAQLDLVTSRWHRSREETDPDAIDESVHRERVLALKRQLATFTAPTSANPTEAMP